MSEPKQPAVEVIHTTNFPALLRQLRGSLFITTYQANRMLVCTGHQEKKISVLMRVMEKPMGLALEQRRMAICGRNKIWYFYPVFGLGDIEKSGVNHEFTFAPRHCHVTGDVASHQAHFVGEDLHFVNTRFSCIATVKPDASFTPLWRPKFVSALTPDDRCHLNGFCYEGNRLRFVSALGETDTPGGWRENKVSGGVVIEAESHAIIARNLCMPHSPKLYGEKLWLLESGKGRLVTIDPNNGKITEVASFQGFLRGLDFFDRFAFVGLCRIRGEKLFRGLPIESKYPELKCGVQVIDITNGNTVAFLEFTRGVEEIFDVGFYHGAIAPHVVGIEGELIDSVMALPSEATKTRTEKHRCFNKLHI